ncbi:hypothetical protein JCM12298_16250 [Desulfothermus naphthae]
MPEMEGISKEVFTLAKHFDSTILGISNLQKIKIDLKKRIFGFSTKWYYCARILAFLMSKVHTINHIYDSLDNWIYLSSIFSKRTILTGVVGNGSLPIKYYQKLRLLIVDSEEQRKNLIQKGLAREKVKVIYPGIDLEPFLKISFPKYEKPFRILFASSPPTVEELESRGVFDLLEAAKNLPDVEFILLWRPWGDSFEKVEEVIKKSNLKNVVLFRQRIRDMRKFYEKCHVAIAPFKKNGGKSCPTFIIEALASGRPVILGPGVGIKSLIQDFNVGLTCEERDLTNKIQIMRDNWKHFVSGTKDFAKEFFSHQRFVNDYTKIYRQILNE